MSYDESLYAPKSSTTSEPPSAPPKRYLTFAEWHRKSALREVMRREMHLELAAKKQK